MPNSGWDSLHDDSDTGGSGEYSGDVGFSGGLSGGVGFSVG